MQNPLKTSAVIVSIPKRETEFGENPISMFSQFWQNYPRKVAKLPAENAWAKLNLTQKAQALTALPKHVDMWREAGDPRFIPHAASWLNAHRFDDELECSLEVVPCRWSGCKKNGTVTKGNGSYCDTHIAALKRGETP